MSQKGNWGIIGGGMLGMTLALRLRQAGHQVTLFESAGNAGGLTSSWKIDDIVWDKFYHVVLMSDLHTRKIISEIGLEGDLNWVETKTGFYSGGKLYSMSNLIEFFQFPPINLIDKFRLGLTIFVASKIRNWQRLEKMLVADWLTRWSGKRVFEKIWLPLLKAKLGENYRNTSAAFIWATIQRMYAARNSGLKKEMFGYVTGGYEAINKQFYEKLVEMGVDFKLNSQVEKIAKSGDEKLKVACSDGSEFSFDQVISTLSPRQSVKLADELEPGEKERHNNIKYLGVICPSLLLRKSISPYYVTNITDEGAPFTGVIEMTALINAEKELKGKKLVYLPKYVDPDDPLFEAEAGEIRKMFLGALLKMYPALHENDVISFDVAKARIVFPLPVPGYSTLVPGISTSIRNLHIVNSAQIINGTLNVNETIKVAESKLKMILNEQP